MKQEMKNYGLPAPEFYEERDCFKVIFRNSKMKFKNQDGGQQSGQQNKSKIDEYKNKILNYCIIPRTSKEISNYLHIKSRQYISTNIIKPLIDEGKLEYMNKKSINAKNQKYVSVKD